MTYLSVFLYVLKTYCYIKTCIHCIYVITQSFMLIINKHREFNNKYLFKTKIIHIFAKTKITTSVIIIKFCHYEKNGT